MKINIITDNNYFFLGLQEKIKNDKNEIRKVEPKTLFEETKDEIRKADVFIFYISYYSVELSYLISTEQLTGQLIFIPTNNKVRFNFAFKKQCFLDANTDAEGILKKIKEGQQKGKLPEPPIKSSLTSREKTILLHTISGMNPQSIGRFLKISIKTVYSHRRNALHKLGGRNIFDIWPIREKIILYESI
ncbi:hypothetical protein BFS14_17770 [Serratia fonticola]|uniref:helix-turn-helix transcriptional regulator n=1 Tax=Serratia fonticola TaxID=47917 RepID=UPI0008FD26E8|nr:helix-turn-helix transcriptional regulator [Serratia fonticola]MBC3253038.1 helix-turn-helix transcriptional regulator [Serratia fonticola]OIX93604.1 hypothetical protein BFS14_17770 [Serratia fonticola]QCR59180.1 helix-turn-helix transcriptional regulator [Serratia fonticola]